MIRCVLLAVCVMLMGCTLGASYGQDELNQPPVVATQPVPDPPVVVVVPAAGSADAEFGILAGVWTRPDHIHRGNELVPLLVPADDRLIILNTQNGGGDVVGEIYDPETNSSNSLGDTNQVWRYNPAVAWTGLELLMVGGGNGPGIDDFVLSHRIGRAWEARPNPSFSVDAWENGIGGPGVWTGSELVMWRSGVAYSPGDEDWRELAAFPLRRRSTESTVWTGTEIIVWGGCDHSVPQCDDAGSGHLTDGAAYDPVTDTWREVAASPLAPGTHPSGRWTGSQVIYYAGETENADGGAWAAAYDPAEDSWEAFPNPPIEPRRYATTAWSGRYFYIWGGSAGLREFGDGAAFDAVERVWLRLPDPPEGSERDRHAMAWVNGHLYITGGHQVNGPLVFTPTSETVVEEAELTRHYEECVIASGFDAGGVQVLVGVSGVPWWVKTGRDVPFEIHGPCFEEIGGQPAALSSWGN